MIFKILIYFINSIFPTYPFERLDLNFVFANVNITCLLE